MPAHFSSSLFATYARSELVFERGEGSFLYAADGTPYLDLASGIAVNALGHAHPKLITALTDQAQKLWHTSNLYRIPGQERLSKRLAAATFADRVFFTNSGAEAVECALKTARKFHATIGQPERYRTITFEGAFHGRTLATIAAGGKAQYLEGFGPPVDGFDQVPFGDIEAVRTMVGPFTGAILIEPIQGEGGIRVPPSGFLKALRALCDETGTLLILDEVQTGVGRTGRLFAYEASGITPDLMAIAKGIGGGFPLGACLATEQVAACMTVGSHGTTYGGNPLAMTVGNAVLDAVLEEGFLQAVLEKGLYFKQKLAQLHDAHGDVIEEVRGEGLMLGLRLQVPAGEFIDALRDQHMLAVAAGENVVRLFAPLNVGEAELDLACDKIDAAAVALKQGQKTVAVTT